jgi:hypothetical protein
MDRIHPLHQLKFQTKSLAKRRLSTLILSLIKTMSLLKQTMMIMSHQRRKRKRMMMKKVARHLVKRKKLPRAKT